MVDKRTTCTWTGSASGQWRKCSGRGAPGVGEKHPRWVRSWTVGGVLCVAFDRRSAPQPRPQRSARRKSIPCVVHGWIVHCNPEIGSPRSPLWVASTGCALQTISACISTCEGGHSRSSPCMQALLMLLLLLLQEKQKAEVTFLRVVMTRRYRKTSVGSAAKETFPAFLKN